MDYTHRTLIRHLLVALVLAWFPVYQNGSYEVLFYILYHRWWMLFLLALSILCGWGADWLVSRAMVKRFVLRLAARYHKDPRILRYESRGTPGPSVLFHWLFLWSRCSRCVSYWSAFLVCLVIGVIYYRENPIPVIAALYFAVLAASLAAAIGVGLQLRKPSLSA